MELTPERAMQARREMNKDLQTKPAGISDSVWSEFKHKRQSEREKIIMDMEGNPGNVRS